MLNVDIAQQFNNSQLFFNKKANSFRCTVPKHTLIVSKEGLMYSCLSSAWQPYSIGNLFDCENINDIKQLPKLQQTIASVNDGSHYFCNNKLCTLLNKLPKNELSLPNSRDDFKFTSSPTIEGWNLRDLILDYDYSCNFKCPSCRNELLNWNRDRATQSLTDKVIEVFLTKGVDYNIRFAGGEPFISKAYRKVWDHIITNDLNCKLTIQTNGSYLHKEPLYNEKLFSKIETLRISFDAGDIETYAITRGGDWQTLLEGCKLARQKLPSTSVLQADFVVQKDNLESIPAFVMLANELGFDKICFQRLWNWNTWTMEVFKSKDVGDKNNPHHARMIELLEPYLNNERYEVFGW